MPTNALVKEPVSKSIPVTKLDFDKQNPRFPQSVAEGPIDALLERFVRDERLQEVIASIADQGYFAGEPLLVTKHGNTGRYTVVEGNRRLAALKLLTQELDVPEGRISIEEIVEHAKRRPTEVACLIFDTQDQILQYLGFRHITGIKSWSALQKARYIKRLHRENYGGTVTPDTLRLLARATGSKPSYIGQVLTSLTLYERAEQENFFGLDLDPTDIDFSVLSTALSYSNIVEYLGLESRTDTKAKRLKEVSLKNVLNWTFVAKSGHKSIVGESRNLSKLAAIVAEPEAVKELIKSGKLDEAFEFSKGPALALQEALASANRRLDAVWQWLPRVPEIDGDHIEKAQEIARLANAVVNALRMRELEPPPPSQLSRPSARPATKRGKANG